MKNIMQYDLIVVGTEKAGIETARAAARLFLRVAVIDRSAEQNGEAPSGTVDGCQAESRRLLLSQLPESPATDEAWTVRGPWPSLENSDSAWSRNGTVGGNLLSRLRDAEKALQEERRTEFVQWGIDHFSGDATFVTPNRLTVAVADDVSGQDALDLQAPRILLADGTQSTRPASIPFDGKSVLTAEQMHAQHELPASVAVLGHELPGLEWAVLLAAEGIPVTILRHDDFRLSPEQRQSARQLEAQAIAWGAEVKTEVEAIGVVRRPNGRIEVLFEDGQRLETDVVLFNAGRAGNTGGLGLATIGLETDEQEKLWRNDSGQTWIDSIYASNELCASPSEMADGRAESRHLLRNMFDLEPWELFDHSAPLESKLESGASLSLYDGKRTYSVERSQLRKSTTIG